MASIRRNTVFIALCILVFWTCKTSKKNEKTYVFKTNIECKPIVKKSDISETETKFDIDTVYISGHKIYIEIMHSGGCGTLDYQLFWSGAMLKSMPPQLPMKLLIKGKDPCRNIIIKNMCFDLDSVNYSEPYIVIIEGYNYPVKKDRY